MWESSLVNVEVNRREFDFLQPWSRRSQTSLRPGIVIGPREILTTADNFDDRTLLRLQNSGRGTWSEAEVKWIDYAANLALLTTTNSGFWAGLKPVAVERGTITDKPLTNARWRGGRLETRRADFIRFIASKGNQTDAMHAVMELNSEIDGTGWGEPVFAGSRLEDLLYAQVVKVRANGRVTEVKTKVIFGKPEAIAVQLANSSVSDTINTSFVERDNLTQRPSNRRLTRRTNGFSKDWFEKQLWLSMAYYHFVLPHHSLRQPLETPEPTRGTGTPKRWKLVTPAMAAGITEHIWTTTELLSYQGPAQFLVQISIIKPLFALPDEVHQGK